MRPPETDETDVLYCCAATRCTALLVAAAGCLRLTHLPFAFDPYFMVLEEIKKERDEEMGRVQIGKQFSNFQF